MRLLRLALRRVAPQLAACGVALSVCAHDLHVQTITVYPPEITLTTARDFQRIVVIGTDQNGIDHDITGECSIESRDEGLIEVRGETIFPVGDGKTTLVVTHGPDGAAGSTVPVTVADAKAERPISWTLDVMPVFMAAGCNSGACHGSARGQDGFRLSLFGFDPDGDYHRVTRELSGRRINLARPDSSLLLRKALGEVSHTGGRRFDEQSPHRAALRRWIASGAPRDPDDVAKVVDLEMYPPSGVLAGVDQTMQLIAIAHYSDGTKRDVTDLAVFRTGNDTSAAVAPGGLLTSGERGEAFITASFDTFTVGSPFIILPDESASTQATAALDEAAANYIDEHIAAKLSRLRIVPSDICSDEVFLRRVYLDMIGLLPTPAEREAFLADESPGKRSALIDRLLERREFIDQWVMQWAELLQIRSNNIISYKSTLLYFEWLRNCFTNEVPLDEMTRRILTAQGGTFTEPATNFYLNQQEPNVLAENVAQAFLGIRIQCAQCHNHPFDRWTQNDYYGFVSFFTQVGQKRAEDRRETIVFDRRAGEMNHPVTGRPMPPKFLGGDQVETRGRDRRSIVAEWLTSPDNPYFARSIANRIWAHFMGVGIVEPVDDFRISNPPSNPALLDALTARLAESGFDIKALVRDICNSNAYQRATQTNSTNVEDNRNFSRALVRRVRAETLLDVVSQVTEVPSKFRGLPLGARAVEIADGTTSTYFLTTFGRARRDSVCACEVVREPSLSQALHLLNGANVNGKIREGDVVGRMIEAGMSNEEIVDSLFVRCMARNATQAEVTALTGMIESDEAAHRKGILNDAFWAILNSNEFVFNH